MDRGERRRRDITKALRKKTIDKEVNWFGHDRYDNLHQYSKNKIHCSCPMCSGMSKTNQKKFRGKGGTWNGRGTFWGTTYQRQGKNWSMQDLKKVQAMTDAIEEFEKSYLQV